jgi:hypothetical protein
MRCRYSNAFLPAIGFFLNIAPVRGIPAAGLFGVLFRR